MRDLVRTERELERAERRHDMEISVGQSCNPYNSVFHTTAVS